MSIPSAILSLEALARKAEYTVEAFNSLNSDAILTKEQSHALESAITRISEVIEVIEDKIDCRKEDHAKWVEADGKPLAARAVSAWQKLLADGRPERVANFSKNITLFFDGPKTYPAIDSSSAKSKNKLTLLRCERIRCLSPQGIISWAAAFAPTAWAGGGKIPDHAFDYLIDNIEPEGFQGWPVGIAEILSGFAAKEPLRQSDSYSAFLKSQVRST